MEPGIGITERVKQLRTLLILTILLFLVVFSPLMGLAIQQLLPRGPVKLGTVEVVIPKSWMLSRQTPTKVNVWKPCSTVFCRALPADFAVEITDMPEDGWERSVKKVLHDDFHGETLTKTISGDSGQLRCIESNPVSANVELMVACFNPDLHLESTFAGKSSFGPAFYAVLASAHTGT